MVLQNPIEIDEQMATSVESLWKGATNHKRLRTTGLDVKFTKHWSYQNVF